MGEPDLRFVFEEAIVAAFGGVRNGNDEIAIEAVLRTPEMQWIKRRLMPQDVRELQTVMDPAAALADDETMPEAVRQWVLS